MDVSRVRALRGPNLWCRQTVIEAIVFCSPDERNIDCMDGFETSLRARFPGIDGLKSAPPGQPSSLAHALTCAALRLQTEAGCAVALSRTTPTAETGMYRLVVEYSEEPVGLLALQLAQELCIAARDNLPFDVDQALQSLRALYDDVRLGPSTAAIVEAAQARHIPYRRLTAGSLVQFGWGSKQRRIQAAEMDSTGAIAEAIAQDKVLTKRLLAAVGVAVPDGRCVTDSSSAWDAAREIGGAVVLKPVDGNQGKGVTVNIQSREQVEAAFELAHAYSHEVIVERYCPGHDFRLLVVGDQLVAAARRDAPQVIGDGMHTITDLVTHTNADPRRGEGHGSALTRIHLDEIAIATMAVQGYSPDSIPLKGALVILRNNGNLSTGGTATDVTDEVHPDVAANAVAAAQMVGLDICGIDLVSENVHEGPEKHSGYIVEVNAAPGLRMHLSPSVGKPRAVGEAIIDHMFPPGETGRIPLVAVTGTNGKTTVVRLVAHLAACSGLRTGMTNSDGVYIGRVRIDAGDCSGPKSVRRVLLHPDVDAAICETARGGLLREGLGFDRCDVAVVTNVGMGDHLGLGYILTVDELACVKRVIVDNLAPGGVAVLNAADPLVAAMAAHCPGSVTFFAVDQHNPIIATHRAQGKRVVYVDKGAIVLAQGSLQRRFDLANIPITHDGTIVFQVENAMAAIAAAWALGLDWEHIYAGIASFVNDAQTAPGRFNLFSYQGATLIADYGHNPDAIAALVQATNAMPASRRTAVISGAGDRRDADIRLQTRLLGDAFDEVILYEDMCQRGRADGEVMALLREGLSHARRTRRVQEVQGELLAIDMALHGLHKGELCLILVDQVETALAHIARRIDEGAARIA